MSPVKRDPKTGRIIGRSDVEITREMKPEPEDFFRYNKKEPGYYYYWAKNDPRRVQQLEREGYEVDPAATRKESSERVEASRQYLKRQLESSSISKADALAAKEALDKLDSGNLDTTVNIPEHIMMRTTNENRKAREEEKQAKSKLMGDKIEADVRDLQKALQRSGEGGIKAFKNLFDDINK